MEKSSKRENSVKIVIAVILLAVFAVFALDDFITDVIWYKSQGYLEVYLTEIVTKLKLSIPVFAAVLLLAKGMLFILQKGFTKKSGLDISGEDDRKKVRRLSWLLSAAFSAVITITVVKPLWFAILEFMNSTEFGTTDPLFNKDIGFYIFKLDFLRGLSSCAITGCIALTAMLAVFYLTITGYSSKMPESVFKETPGPSDAEAEKEKEKARKKAKNRRTAEMIFGMFLGIPVQNVEEESFEEESAPKSSRNPGDLKAKGKALLSVASGQITLLGVLLFVGVAVRFYLRQFDLLYGGTGACYGAGYTDINVTLNVYRAIMVLSLLAAVMLVFAVRKRSIKLASIFPVLMIVVALIGTGASTLVQNLIVSPDELSKESKYLENNIKYTRLAYNLQDIKVKDFSGEGEITKENVLDNMETFSNIRINDFAPAQQFYNQTQSIRSYYTFNDVDVDRYYVNGEYTQCFLSAREIDQSKIDDSWLIRHLKYTHGYGVTLSRVDKVTGSGQPDMLISGIPPVSEVPEIDVARPEIYYGESTDSYVITNTGEAEFDYPSGESNVYCEYEGNGGIKLTPVNRLLFALKERSLKLLISTNISSDSRIHIYRNIMTRAKKIAPFLQYNDDPYIVSEDGKLYWIIDAYTTSSLYPYSEPYENLSDTNYIRNSVKVVVDAYSGEINYYVCDETDPIVNTLAKIYPALFKTIDEMPESLRAHMQYPNSLFNIQAYVYTKYHMTDVAVFYQSEDLWSIASEQYGQETKLMEPNYFIMKLPGEDSAEFVSTLPYTPSGKSNLTGILTARQDGDQYGQLVLYRMPKDRTVYGPAQIEAQINQDSEISKEFSLWNNSGSSYLRGNMFVIPVEDTLLYVEPIYLEASTGSLPEVKRVVAFYGDKVAYQPTLADCLNSLFGEGTGDPLNTAYPIVSGHQMAEDLRNAALMPPEPEKPEKKPEEAEPQAPEAPKPELDPEFAEKSIEELAALAQQAYDGALSAMQSGDWISYGQYMDMLSKYISAMAGTKTEEMP